MSKKKQSWTKWIEKSDMHYKKQVSEATGQQIILRAVSWALVYVAIVYVFDVLFGEIQVWWTYAVGAGVFSAAMIGIDLWHRRKLKKGKKHAE